jgi:hypothetical protein
MLRPAIKAQKLTSRQRGNIEMIVQRVMTWSEGNRQLFFHSQGHNLQASLNSAIASEKKVRIRITMDMPRPV